MSNSVVLADKDFRESCRLLRAKKRTLLGKGKEFAEALVNFAGDLVKLQERAKALDKANKSTIHTDEVREIATIDGTSVDASSFSKWQTIGNEARNIRSIGYAKLPSSRDALYEVAKLTKGGASSATLGKLTPTMTVRDIRGLKTRKKRKTPTGRRKHQATESQTSDIPFSKPLELGIAFGDLPDVVQKALNAGGGWLIVRRSATETGAPVLVATSFLPSS